MYHEERVIDGVLHYRARPGDKWVAYSAETLTEMLMRARTPEPAEDSRDFLPSFYLDKDSRLCVFAGASIGDCVRECREWLTAAGWTSMAFDFWDVRVEVHAKSDVDAVVQDYVDARAEGRHTAGPCIPLPARAASG